MTYIVACISPDGNSFGETLSTLQFAKRAKAIKNRAVINEDQTGSVLSLKNENERLKAKLRQLETMGSIKDRRMTMMASPKYVPCQTVISSNGRPIDVSRCFVPNFLC
jgi:hypothetical protein